ncbi:methylthioribose-1-phosphate isomerase [Synergistales bacterium]|nr:methylthioribose-1-phosphate isomerase [Synergistales bacterium]
MEHVLSNPIVMKAKNLFDAVQPVVYKDGKVFFLDQTALPTSTEWVEIDSVEACRSAVRGLVVRGAPAIGIAAAFGMVVAARGYAGDDMAGFLSHMKNASDRLATARPTAVNLVWALRRVYARLDAACSVGEAKDAALREALLIQKEDEEICRSIGVHGLSLLRDGMTILTHCNAGALATSCYGTALAPVYVARERGMNIKVFADETRPLLQGSRLTAYELLSSGVDVTLITDSMAAYVMGKGLIDACIVGCDRVAANGDAANKIGTYGVALIAKAHNIPFYVACPLSTIDPDTPTGGDIVIEERDASEVVSFMGKASAPGGVKALNPAFDVTPSSLISAIITEKGVLRPPYSF